MEKFSNSALRILAWLCAILFVAAAAIALVFFNAEHRLFNPESYLRAFEAQNLYEQFPKLAADIVTDPGSSARIKNLPDFLKTLPAEGWEEVIRAVLPEEMSRSITEQGVNSIFAYLNGQSETASLSLVEFKAYLDGPDGLQAVNTLLRNQPDCTFAQLAEMTALSLLGEPARFYLCKLPGQYTNENGNYIFSSMIEEGLHVTTASLPDEIQLIPEIGPTDSLLAVLRALRGAMRASIWLPLVLLFLITIFAVRDLKSGLQWWGASFIGAGALGLLAAALVNPLFKWGYIHSIQSRLPIDLPASVTDTLRAIVSTVLSGISAPIAFESIFILSLGIVMLLATRAKKKNPATFSPPAL